MRKNCSSDREKLLKFEAEMFEITRTIYSNSERSEQFLVKDFLLRRNNDNRSGQNAFLTCSWRFLISNKSEQL